MNIKRKPAPPARTFYLASLTPAGSMQGTTEEIVLSEGAAAMVIAWTATSGAPRVQIFGDSWLGMRRWQDIFWEMGNLAREEVFSPLIYAPCSLIGNASSLSICTCRLRVSPIHRGRKTAHKQAACRLMPPFPEFRGTFDPRVLSISGA